MWRLMAVILLCVGSASFADGPRYEVLQIEDKPDPSSNDNALHQKVSFTLGEFEHAEIVTFIPNGQNISQSTSHLEIQTPKGFFWYYRGGESDAKPLEPMILPARSTITLVGTRGYAVFRVFPDVFPVEKTAIVLPGPGGADVQMECSTDLVHWSVATPGVYTNQPVAKFFRVTLKKIEPTP